MKKRFQIIISIIFIFISSVTLAQNFIKDFPGIPLEIGYDWWYTNRPETFTKMKEMGVDIIHGSLSESWQLDTLRAYGLKIIPFKSFNNNWIQLYTDAKYTIWEAEGTPVEFGEATLEPDTTTEVITAGNEKYIRLKSLFSGSVDTLIRGPYYTQEIYYIVNNDGIPVKYWADFRMKLELNSSFEDIVNPNTPLCILQVTQSRIYPDNNPPWTLECTYVIEQDTITREMFNSLNEFKEFRLVYDLGRNDCQITAETDPAHYRMLFSDTNPRMLRSYIQFKVIWLGTQNYIPSLDRVIVSDQRGRELKNPTTSATSNIIFQACSTIVNNEDVVAGWFGIDEPHSIDNFEPIRVVDSILNSKSNNHRPAWFPMMTQWLGAWDNPANTLGTMGVNRVKEFYSRLGGNANIFQTYHLYNQPYETNYGGLYPCNCSDFRDKNIEYMVKNNYKLDYEQDEKFGVSIQCSKQQNVQAHLSDVRSWELLYNTNMALMTGAKYIQLYTYFAEREFNDPNTVYTTTGMINSIDYQLVYTDKYNMWRDTLKPRLHGLLGKTLKIITPKSQMLNVIAGPISGGEYISNIWASRADIPGENEFIAVYNDLGFFEKGDKEYFMLLNRHYNLYSKFKYKITINHPDGFNNYKIKDYVDTTEWIIQNGSYFIDTISIGDARLYSVLPVVKYGGKLIVDESVGEGITLTDDMSIETGATLYVYGEYNANADITIKPGGKIVSGDNGKIIFSNGHQLVIEGNAQINGSANNRLEIVFKGSNSGGIKIRPNGTLKAFYCNIVGSQGAVNGITSESPTKSVTIENVSLSGFEGYGISLHGSFGEGIPDITPSIKNCSITNCEYGISIANFYEFVISENTITDCKLGINIAHIPAAFVVGNNITYSSNPELWGIFMLSSNGNIRGNTVSGHTNGLYLVYSSPNIGGNILEYNSEHGLFVDVGSVPNLVRGLTGPLPLVIATSGYNIIKENGNEGFGPMNGDGSEIFLRDSYIYMSEGCNHVIDDRGQPENFLLMNGYTSEGSEIKAEYNYWGTTEPSNQRFGDLVVNFDPFNHSPYYTGPCTTPQGACEEVAERTSKGELVDMIAVKNCEVQQLTELEQKYAEAQMHYLSGEMDESRIAYQQIVGSQSTPEEKLSAYNKLYAIGNLIDTTNNYFTELQNIFSNLAQSISDSVLKAVFRQNEILCKVSKEEYTSAINDFDNIIQQNPQSEEAVFAEMDLLTTALLMDTTNSSLGKVSGGKYMVKGSGDYLSKMNELVNKNFNKGKKEKERIIPTEFALSQNYPNPFNPTTKIKYQLPNAAQISLKVFDILGREVATLVNEEKPAGYYEVNFDAQTLSSGCYFYRIFTKDFIKTMKMMVVK